jgi:predicted adenine nucleotide alpha hydrolase (AANH) superfamily ATPase
MNYNELMKEEINKLNYTPKLLLHSCCAPCSSHVITLLSNYFDITIFYYNPNIDTLEEYEKRKTEQKKFIKEFKNKNKLDFLDCDYENDIYLSKVKGLENEPERGARCPVCFKLRLEKTVQEAKKLNYDYFATTLTVSPYKNSNQINEIGLNLEKEYQIKYLVSDLKKENGYLKSIELSKQYNLYRQNYCGCKFSKNKN